MKIIATAPYNKSHGRETIKQHLCEIYIALLLSSHIVATMHSTIAQFLQIYV